MHEIPLRFFPDARLPAAMEQVSMADVTVFGVLFVLLDVADGILARRSKSGPTRVGAALDVESDSIAVLFLSLAASRKVGWSVLTGYFRRSMSSFEQHHDLSAGETHSRYVQVLLVDKRTPVFLPPVSMNHVQESLCRCYAALRLAPSSIPAPQHFCRFIPTRIFGFRGKRFVAKRDDPNTNQACHHPPPRAPARSSRHLPAFCF